MRTKFVTDQIDRLQRLIDEACGPGNMTPDQAIDFLEEIATHCESAVEALREEQEPE